MSIPLLRKRIHFKRASSEGQMTVEERKAIYHIVRKAKPHTVFEIGTWKGGGSTYILSSALYHNGRGVLYTVEACAEFYEHAVSLYLTSNDLPVSRTRPLCASTAR
jgi:predicted O-methyltransferase YrrM